jgi:DNA invertase Pin-like site-specific DNA recombinase
LKTINGGEATMTSTEKVSTAHLERNAYLYIRQSSLKQVVANKESGQRQYALTERAVVLGWSKDHIVVIDDDTGQSGAEAHARKGFQRLVAEVGMGMAGIVMGLEVSRLARNNADWHRLLEICALAGTLILDEDGVYDPGHFNDRLLLGLKGTMSEAELHILRARLRGGVLNKARRGELKLPLPVGFVYDEDKVVLDPNQHVQESIRHFFKTFKRTGSAYLTVRAFRQDDMKFPKRLLSGPDRGQLVWTEMTHSRALNILHNPRYAGVFSYGRTRQPLGPKGKVKVHKLPRDRWTVCLPDSHDGYITYEDFLSNERQLAKNSASYGRNTRQTPPREGPALLQGIVLCGICGKIGELLIELMTPLTLEVSLAVQKELEIQAEEVERLRRKAIEQAGYEADLARRRYMSVSPENRLVADTLEAEWNEKLRLLKQTEQAYEQQRKQDPMVVDEDKRADLKALIQDFPRLWKDPCTSPRDRKRMTRLLIEDVTLKKGEKITVAIRFKGGATKVLELDSPLNYFMARKTAKYVVKEIDQLLNHHKDSEIASILNEKGWTTGDGLKFTSLSVMRIRQAYKLKSRHGRLRAKGLYTRKQMETALGISSVTLQKLKDHGLIRAYQYGDGKSNILYEPPTKEFIEKICDMKRRRPRGFVKSLMRDENAQEVQYEA